MTIHPNKAKLIFELMKLVFNPFGIYGLIFIIKSLRFGLLSTPVTIELTFRGLHYMSVAREIEKRRGLKEAAPVKTVSGRHS